MFKFDKKYFFWGFIFFCLGIGFAGSHSANQVLDGTFLGDYIFSGNVEVSTLPTNPNQVANKAYVDAASSGSTIEPIENITLTGNIYGLGYRVYPGSANNLIVSPGVAIDDTYTKTLKLTQTYNYTLAAPVSTIYHIFIYENSSNEVVIGVDTDENGANLTNVLYKRWIGLISINPSTSEIYSCYYNPGSNYLSYQPILTFRSKYFAKGTTEIATLNYSTYVPITDKIATARIGVSGHQYSYHTLIMADVEDGNRYMNLISGGSYMPPRDVVYTTNTFYSRVTCSSASSAAAFTLSWNLIGLTLNR